MTTRESIIAALDARLRTTGLALYNRPISEPPEGPGAFLALIPQGSSPQAVANGVWRHGLAVVVLISGPTTAAVDAALEAVLVALAADLTLGGLLETAMTCSAIDDTIDKGRGIIYGRTLTLRLPYETARWRC